METQLVLKRINISTAIILGVLFFALLVLVFYKPIPKTSAVIQKNSAEEKLRQSEMKIVNAKLDSIRISQRYSEEIAEKKDNDLTDLIIKNTEALNKNRNEKPRDFSRYSSVELQREVSKLVRLYNSSQSGNTNPVTNR